MTDGTKPMQSSDATASGALDRAATERGQNRMRRVFVEDYEMIGSVGVYEHERRYEQRIVVSLHLDVVDGYDGQSDDIAGVWDYDQAIRAIRDTVDSGHFNLLETLAERIAAACLAHACVAKARVRVAKPDVLIACHAVGIEIVRAS